ncbi:hypothetical protein KAF25_007388 [Fusarium avenaceum]|uniref:Uncharacterized protein n=1 Tax=Fusarium avenaceum TaxID=40199 RepID=A0A9P7H0J0_9HYPO|nr:hypothetical protein KAF25_007388 [Fusarium avenaceum]
MVDRLFGHSIRQKSSRDTSDGRQLGLASKVQVEGLKSESQSSPPRISSRQELDPNWFQPPLSRAHHASRLAARCVHGRRQMGTPMRDFPLWTTGPLLALSCGPSCAHLFLEWRSDEHRETIF